MFFHMLISFPHVDNYVDKYVENYVENFKNRKTEQLFELLENTKYFQIFCVKYTIPLINSQTRLYFYKYIKSA